MLLKNKLNFNKVLNIFKSMHGDDHTANIIYHNI